MPMYRIMQLILYLFEKSHRLTAFGIIIHTGSIKDKHLLVHHLLILDFIRYPREFIISRL